MALSDQIQDAADLFHEGSTFLHEVATGDDTTVVTNPVDQIQQDSVAKVLKSIKDTDEHVSYKVNQVKTPTEKTQAKSNIDLDQVDNTSDVDKPVSTAQAAAIAVVQADADTNETDITGLDTRLSAVESTQASNRIAYQTLALLNADLAHDENTLAEVTNDPTPATNNGLYIKVGASGSGSWLKSTNDVSGRVSTNESDIAALETRMDDEETVTADIETRMQTEEAATSSQDARITVLENTTDIGFQFTEQTPTDRLLIGDVGKVITKGGLLSLDPNTFPLDSEATIICSADLEVVAESKGDIIGDQLKSNRVGFKAGRVINVRNIGGSNWLMTPKGEAFNLTPQTDYGFASLNLSDQNTIVSGSDITSWDSVEPGGYLFANAAYPSNIPTVNASSLNGFDTVNFGTGNEFLDHTLSSAMSGENTVVVLVKATKTSASAAIVDSTSGARCLIRQNSDNTYKMFTTTGLDGGTVDTSWHLVVAHFNGASSSLEVDNVQVASGSVAALSAASLRLGVTIDLSTADFEGEMALFGHVAGTWGPTQKANFIAWVNQRYNLSI